MTISELPLTSVTTEGRRRLTPYVLWILPIGLGLLVLSLALGAFVHRASSPGSSWPLRIVVDGRNYDRGTSVPAADLLATPGHWQQVAVAGPGQNPVYALVIPGAAPTAVVVATSMDHYVSYTLVGGP